MNGFGVSEFGGPTPVDGCVEVIAPSSDGAGAPPPPGATPTPLSSNADVFLLRCGVLLAASAAAHRALPELPVASAHERALVQQWMTQR